MITKGKEIGSKQYGFAEVILEELYIFTGINDDNVHYLDVEKKQDDTLAYLKTLLGKKLDKEQQKELAKKLNIKDNKYKLQ